MSGRMITMNSQKNFGRFRQRTLVGRDHVQDAEDPEAQQSKTDDPIPKDHSSHLLSRASRASRAPVHKLCRVRNETGGGPKAPPGFRVGFGSYTGRTLVACRPLGPLVDFKFDYLVLGK